jgi:phospholipid/cholesterol/gamma-HCH transport system substrate-binding protein
VVGAFVLASLLLLLFGVYFLKETRPGSKTDVYHARFEQVSTLQEGDPVKVNGVKMGKVTTIELQQGSVQVTFQIRRGVRLPEDSEVRIQNIGLMGERQVGIRLGSASEALAPGGTLQGRLDAGIAEAMGVAGEMFVEADSLVKALRSVLDSTLAHPEFAGRVNGLVAATEDVTRRLSLLAKDVDPRIREGAQAFQNLGREAEEFVRTQEPQVVEILKHTGEAARRARDLAERGERVAQGLEEVLAKANSKDGTTRSYHYDDAGHVIQVDHGTHVVDYDYGCW